MKPTSRVYSWQPVWIMTPRSRRPRPASAVERASNSRVDDKVETMIQAAHEHFLDTSCSREDEEKARWRTRSPARLADHMDSFPLVPLSVISLLRIEDLEQVERGLATLLESLTSNEGDEQLGNYATRQLTLVRRHLTHQRAQERVVQLLRGDVKVALAPIKATTLKKSSSTTAVSITPLLPTLRSNQMRELKTQWHESDAASWHWKSKKAAVETARMTVQTNATKRLVSLSKTGFMISGGEKASRKRRRPRKVTRTLEEEARDRTRLVERERENRRQAACQRLQARRELQAKKKQESKHKIQETRKEVDDATAKQRATCDSDEESEGSDVSNCSESDEANEKAILALDVQISSSVEGEDSGPSTERSDSARKDVSQEEEMLDPSDGHVDRSFDKVEEPEKLIKTILSGAEEVRADSTRCNEVDEEQPEDVQDESFALDLQRLMTLRAAAKLDQLHVEKDARKVFATARPGRPPLAATLAGTLMHDKRPSVALWLGSEDGDDAEKCLDSNEDATEESILVTKTRTGENEVLGGKDDRPSVEAELGPTILVRPRSPVAACNDYRSYFRTFNCILTSVYEQSRPSLSSSSSSTSLYSRPVDRIGDHTMRLQQNLYQSWQSIMYDYATVFGPKIVVPEGMVPLAAAKPWTPHYRINSTARKEVAEIVTQALHRLGGGWEDHPAGLGLKTTWNLLWTWSKPRVERQALLVWQKVNHFQQAKALTRKDCLKKIIGKYQAASERLRHLFEIIPLTFLLPKEYVRFVHAFQERSERLRHKGIADDKNIWIMKPVALSRGRGISLVNDLSQVIYSDQVVIQEYIAAPRLLDGYKFDLRLYVLVTSFNPLEAFIYDEGFVRLCTRPYEDSDISNIFVHLTNSSIQKDSDHGIEGRHPAASVLEEDQTMKECEISGTDTGGTKRSLAYLWKRLAAEGVDVEEVKRSIDEVVLKALLCGEDQIPFQINSFDLFGYDILLDSNLRPWLLEINSSPSMARDYALDYHVKDAMMLDTLGLVNPLHFDRAKLAEVIARRQRDEEDEKKRPHAYTRHPREVEELAARQLNEDLTAILRGKIPRAYGEMPEHLGRYRRLCPHTNMYNQLVKLKKSGTRRA